MIFRRQQTYVLHTIPALGYQALYTVCDTSQCPGGECKTINREEAEKIFGKAYTQLVTDNNYKPIWA